MEKTAGVRGRWSLGAAEVAMGRLYIRSGYIVKWNIAGGGGFRACEAEGGILWEILNAGWLGKGPLGECRRREDFNCTETVCGVMMVARDVGREARSWLVRC
jgi:hypothetical protein